MTKGNREPQIKIKTPNGVLYCLVYLLIYPFLKTFFLLKVDRADYNPPKGPFIVLCNHLSFMDFLLVMLTIYPIRLNAVAAQKFFLYHPLDKLLPFMGCIPKNLFDVDIRPIRGIIAVLKRGGRVLLFPEGRCSVDGVYAGMHKNSGKLIKTLGVPVITCHIEGSYVCMPFWRKGFRRGRVRVTLANLFSAEETRLLPHEELTRRIDERLSGADLLSPFKNTYVFHARKLAEGLQNILYYCPNCKQEFTLITKGNRISCTACGNAATMNRNSRLTPHPGSVLPESVHIWYKEQAVYEHQLLHENMEPMTVQVKVRLPAAPGMGLIHSGRGILRLEPDGWYYEGELQGMNRQLFFPIETVPAIPFDPNDNFQIYSNGNFYVFTPEDNPAASAKYATIGECAYWRFASPVKMTPGYDSGFPVEQPSEQPAFFHQEQRRIAQ